MPKAARAPRPSSDPRQQLGLMGEEAVKRWLVERGWTIEAHRFRMGHFELDLVIRRGSLVAFVEVKTRRGGGYGPGREAVGWKKRLAIASVAEAWRQRHGKQGDTYRFDVVEVDAGPTGVSSLVQIEDAWRITK